MRGDTPSNHYNKLNIFTMALGPQVIQMLIDEETRKKLKARLDSDMGREIELIAVLGKEKNEFMEFTESLVTELGEIGDKVKGKVVGPDSKEAKKYKVERYPTVLMDPKNYNIRYTGAPAGEEGWGFIETMIMISNDDSKLSEEAKNKLNDLKDDRAIQVFVTPACPYCPMAVVLANQMAIEAKAHVSSECVEAYENEDLAQKYNVRSVPLQVINGKVSSVGVQKEMKFVEDVIKG